MRKKTLYKPFRFHSKSKATFQLSPRLKEKTNKNVPEALVRSFDSNLLTKNQRLNTPSQKCLQKPTNTMSLLARNKQKLNKSTVKLTINLCESEKKSIKNESSLRNSNNYLQNKQPLTPQAKIILFETEENIKKPFPKNTNNNKSGSYNNKNIPSTSLNLSSPAKNTTTNTNNNNNNNNNSSNANTNNNTNSNLDQLSLISLIKSHFQSTQRPPASSLSFYQATRGLGKGSFGRVLLCTHLLTSKPVAIKQIDKSQLKTPIAEKRLLQEIQFLKRLDHPNVIKLLEVFESDLSIFLVTEYISHGNLYTLLKTQKKGRVCEATARALFLQILKGLDYIHSQGILHRDIKLDNILIDSQNRVKICDFGISRLVVPGHRMTEQSGTPAFMAPEILKNQGYSGFASDYWSLGVVLYALLTGTLPFRGNCAAELNENIKRGEFNKEIPASAQAREVIEKLLTVECEKRAGFREICACEWLANEVFSEETVSLLPKKQAINEEIVKIIEKFGVPKQFIEKSIESKALGLVNVCYNTLIG